MDFILQSIILDIFKIISEMQIWQSCFLKIRCKLSQEIVDPTCSKASQYYPEQRLKIKNLNHQLKLKFRHFFIQPSTIDPLDAPVLVGNIAVTSNSSIAISR